MSDGSPQLSDEQVIAAVLTGDRELFGELVERYQARLVNYLYRLLRNLDEAHDLAQEVFFKVYRALDRYDPRFRFSTWLFRVAQNSAIDRMRKRRLRLVSMSVEDGEDGRDRDWEFPSEERNAYGHLRNRERGDAIHDAVATLPWEYRELVLLRHFAELSYEEIASLKGMPLGTVKNKLFRGRQMLKDKLAGFVTD